LTDRLDALGGSPSIAKSALAHFLGFTPAIAQIGHSASERNTQHLIMASAAAAGEMAMYEALSVAASEAGDEETEALARKLQKEEKEDYEDVWKLLSSSARRSFTKVAEQTRSKGEISWSDPQEAVRAVTDTLTQGRGATIASVAAGLAGLAAVGWLMSSARIPGTGARNSAE
jgi:hypothetical protein